MSDPMPRPDLDRILRYLNKKLPPDSVLEEADIQFLERCIDAIHAGRKAILIVEKDGDGTIDYMFSATDRVEACRMMQKVILTQVRKRGFD